MCVLGVPGGCGGQKRILRLLELELHTAVSEPRCTRYSLKLVPLRASALNY